MAGLRFTLLFFGYSVLLLFKPRPFKNWPLIFDAIAKAVRKFSIEISHLSVPEQRIIWDSLAQRAHPIFLQTFYKTIEIKGIPALCITPIHNAKPKNQIFYIYGDSFICGSLRTYKQFCTRISLACNAELTVPDYKLAPEYQFPYQLETLLIALREFIAQNAAAERSVFVAGDSAGGNLAMALMLKLEPGEIDNIAGLILISPWGDLTQLDGTIISNSAHDLSTPKIFQSWVKYYLGNASENDPLASPFLATFNKLPPIFLTVGSAEMRFSQVDRFNAMNREKGISIEYHVAEYMIHNWARLYPNLKASKQMFNQLRQFVASRQRIS